jgi:hypothetical protein
MKKPNSNANQNDEKTGSAQSERAKGRQGTCCSQARRASQSEAHC